MKKRKRETTKYDLEKKILPLKRSLHKYCKFQIILFSLGKQLSSHYLVHMNYISNKMFKSSTKREKERERESERVWFEKENNAPYINTVQFGLLDLGKQSSSHYLVNMNNISEVECDSWSFNGCLKPSHTLGNSEANTQLKRQRDHTVYTAFTGRSVHAWSATQTIMPLDWPLQMISSRRLTDWPPTVRQPIDRLVMTVLVYVWKFVFLHIISLEDSIKKNN